MITSLVVTTISHPNDCLLALARGCAEHKWSFFVIGDRKTPTQFDLPPATFLSIAAQRGLPLDYPRICPENTYARKNVGYLAAAKAGATTIVETDDDNRPLPMFWAQREVERHARLLSSPGWVNVYQAFSPDNFCWPRGYPLEYVKQGLDPLSIGPTLKIQTPVQQGLANCNPDVDAVYRMTGQLPVHFADCPPVALESGAWCPFNSQNTSWFRQAFRLMYLPACCSFRMTDIWRSLIAQRIGWVQGWRVLFDKASVEQIRNSHDLLSDFRDEVPGYLGNNEIVRILNELEIFPTHSMSEALKMCYGTLASHNILSSDELPLLDAWLSDCDRLDLP